MFHHDVRHTGVGLATGPSTATLKWRYQTGDGVVSSPAIGADGTIYVGSDDRYVYAIGPGNPPAPAYVLDCDGLQARLDLTDSQAFAEGDHRWW